MDLARELNRPVSMHCVRAFGKAMEIFQQMSGSHKQKRKKNINNNCKATQENRPDLEVGSLPPAIILHSYGGTAGMMDSLLKIDRAKRGVSERFFFSFSKLVNMRSPKTLDVIKCVPPDRLLIESDEHSPLSLKQGLEDTCELVAQARGWNVEDTASITYRNATNIFSFWNNKHHTD